MEGITKARLFAVGAMMLFLLCLGTCRLTQFNPPKREPVKHDTTLATELIDEKLSEASDLQKEAERLQVKNDSLLRTIKESKKSLLLATQRAIQLETQLRETLTAAKENPACPDSLIMQTSDYIKMQSVKDSLCTQTIAELETAIATKDSSISTHLRMENTLREVVQLQDYKTQGLTGQLNEQIKATHKKTIQNKWLRGGLLILSGAAAAYVIKSKQ